MFVRDLRSDFYQLLVNQRLLIFVHYDTDGLCALKILQYLFKCDHVMYTLVPVEGKSELLRSYQDNAEPFKYILMINCGATIDICEFLDPGEEKVFFVADSHRPLEVCNVYNDGQVRLLMKQEDAAAEDGIPDFEDIFKDDSDAEATDEDEDGEEGAENKRPRFDEAKILKQRDRRIWEEKRKKILFEYQQFSYYGPSTAVAMYELAWRLSRDDNDLLWWAIVGHTEQHVALKIEVDAYVLGTGSIRDHVSRLNNRVDGDAQAIDCMKLAFDKELNLNLYRHWSLFESLSHTIYTAAKFKIWTAKGRQRLSEFLADLGLPLVQCKQKFATMDLGLRTEISSTFEDKADKYGLEEISYGSFTAQFGYRHRFCAADLVHSTVALMDRVGGNAKDGISAEKSTAADNILEALDSLSRSQVVLLEHGLDLARQQLESIMTQVQTFLDLRVIVSAGPFLYAIIEDGSPNCRRFSRPNVLALLAHYTLRAYVAVTPSKKVHQLPLVVAAPLSADAGTCLVLGVPPVTDRSRRNLLGKAFEQAAKRTNSRYLLDYFDASIIQLKTEDRSKFFDGLVSLLS